MNNHLTVIIGVLDMLVHDTSADDPHFHDLVDARASAIAAANLIGKSPGNSTSSPDIRHS